MIRVRLHAIDAPERDQPHGAASKAGALDSWCTASTVASSRSNRTATTGWSRGSGSTRLDVNAEMIKQGAAWVYRRYADDAGLLRVREGRAGSAPRPVGTAAVAAAAPWEWRQRKTLGHQFTDYSTESVAACVASLGR